MFAALLAALACAAPVQAANLFVDQVNGSDANDGMSWGTARATVTSAIATATTTPEADVISVAAGRYLGQVSVPPDVTLLGGFPSGGGARDSASNETILDGNRQQPVVRFPAGSDGTVLDGFTIENPLNYISVGGAMGGGILVEDSAPVIRGNLIHGNSACSGAGVALLYSAARPAALVVGNVITENTDNFPGSVGDCNPVRPAHGCGLYVQGPAGADLGTVTSGNWITGNGNRWSRSAVYVAAHATLKDDVIIDNGGHGVELSMGPAGLNDVLITRSTGYGIVVACPGTFSIRDVTVADNAQGGVIVACLSDTGSTIAIDDSIVWRNANPEIQLAGGAVSLPVVSHSIVQGGWAGGTNVLDADPHFAPGPEGDYYLSQLAGGQAVASPAVDAGDQPASGLGLDLLTTATTSTPDAGIVDMGFHYAPVASLDVWRGTTPSSLAPYRTVAALPFTDDTGTLSDPARPLLFYAVPEANNEIGILKDTGSDAVRLEFR